MLPVRSALAADHAYPLERAVVRSTTRCRAGYDDMLSSMGLAGAADLALRFGIDVRDGAFWTASLDILRRRITEHGSLVAGMAPPG